MENIQTQLLAAQNATASIKRLTTQGKQVVLLALAESLEEQMEAVLLANRQDLNRMDVEDPKYDRLLLNQDRVQGLVDSLRVIAKLPDPTGHVLSKSRLPNGLEVTKKTVPLGVVGVIYESRPNVTIDVAALCIRSGNVCVLRGGTDAWFTNLFLVELIQKTLVKQHLPAAIVQLLPTDRAFVLELLTATDFVDILIPRGSQALIDFVRQHAKVPVIETGAGVCHTFVERSADIALAAKVVANAKISRPSVCNALDTIIVEAPLTASFLKGLMPEFLEHQVQVYADVRSFEVLQALGYPYLNLAKAADFGREFLSLACSIKVVDDFQEALAHIRKFSSKHSECIIATDPALIEEFMETVDAAAVYANASTRFTDGGEFGLGAEIGISTQKLHARGPFALEKLVTEKWFVTGEGQIR